MRTSLLVLIALVTTLLTNGARADGDRTIPGAACNEQYNSSTYVDSYARKYNTSSSTKYWICPIERECTLDDTESAWMYVIDRHYDNEVKCTLYMRTYSGGSADYETESTDGSSSSAQKLTFDSTLSSSSYGYVYFYCEIPGYYSSSSNRSGVVSYYNTEGC